MPILAAALDFAKLEGRNFRAHQIGSAPASPVTGQLYYNSGDNTLYWWDGTVWVSGRGTGPATAGTLGTIQLAGDLAGTATSPQIAAGAIMNADVNAAAAIATTKLSPDPLARASHTGTQLASTVSDFNTAVRTNRLDQMAAPTAPVGLGSQKITSLAEPTAATDGATKNYVDTFSQGLDAKQSVRVATTGNITSFTSAGSSFDGIGPLGDGDRILLKDQTNPAQNGIYTWTAPGELARAGDADTWNDLPSAYVWVEQGTTQADTGWVCTADRGGTLGTTSVPWTQFSGAAQITSGYGLTKTGNTLDVGGGPGIQVNPDGVQVANDGITNAMLANGAVNLATADVTGALPIANGGTGATSAPAARSNLGVPTFYSSAVHGAGTTITITQATHACNGTRGLLVQVQEEATGNVELADVSVSATGTVTVTFGVSVAANSKRVTVMG